MMLTTSSKVNAAKKLAASGRYEEAVEIADKISYEKVSSIHELTAIANIYLHTKQYEDAKTVYIEMYHRAKTHRVMVGLIDLCLKTQEPKQAEHYIREFRKLEPENPERLVFRYRVDVMLGKSNEYLLKSLTKLKDEDYSDIWGLELAKIYFKEGDLAACVKECRDILLWFPDSDLLPKVKILLNACEDVLEQEPGDESRSVEVVEITTAEKAIPTGTYDRIIYDDDDDDEDDYVIRGYFNAGVAEASAKAPETSTEFSGVSAEASPANEEESFAEEVEALPLQDTIRDGLAEEAEDIFAEGDESEEVPVGEDAAASDREPGAGIGEEPDVLPEDLGNLRTEELVYDMDSSLWEVPDDGMLPANSSNSWMKGMDVASMPSQPADGEQDLTDAAINAVFQEDEAAIEQALYDLLKK